MNITLKLPFNIASSILGHFSKGMSFGYSNVPSPSVNYNFGGHKCNDICVFLPGFGIRTLGLILVTHG